jgi:hypothetical protein
MMRPLKTATVCLAVCATLDGRPQAPPQAGGSKPGQTSSPQAAVPPEVDQALRAHVAEFYQDLINGKYRAADRFVAEDSKDTYIAMTKPRIKGFDIIRIDYSENFTKAEVALLCPGEWYMNGQKFAMKIPVHDLWKIEDGQWLWYVVPEKNVLHTPFGTVHKSDAELADNHEPPALKDPQAAARAILSLVSLDRDHVTLRINRKDTAQVLIKNGMPGSVEVQESHPQVKGFKVTLDKKTLAAGETAKLVLQTEGEDVMTAPPDAKVEIFVQPTSRLLPVTVKFLVAGSEPAPSVPSSSTPTSGDKEKPQK